ncbi:MAG: excinuclease ABC subunit UvrA [Deltaproteobacteria bacterium]|jgi:excinuclease ABC subunit A|nr:excinuclease ABC subunit UvrA [Deltaproteobacteria bacterium]
MDTLLSLDTIIIRGAREHNLKNLDVDIPRDSFTVITGLSGSGKSSLAFDTLCAEAQRRFVESLSAYARQFLSQLEKPDVDLIEGLSPAISIEQKTTSKNPRSTVGTVTEIHDYYRLLFSRAGQPHCYKCGRPIKAQSPITIVDKIEALPEGTRLLLLAPVVEDRKGEHQKIFDRLRKDGFARVRVGGQILELSEDISLDKKKKHNIEVVVDRLVLKDNMTRRLTESVELSLRQGGGVMTAALLNPKGGITSELFFSENFACDHCGLSFPELTPQLFSFNNPQGACPACDGLGANIFFDPELIVPNPELSLAEGAIAATGVGLFYQSQLDSLAKHYRFNMNVPFRELPKRIQNIIFHGSGKEEIRFTYERDGDQYYYTRNFEGIANTLARRYKETEQQYQRDDLARFMSFQPCPECQGARLRPEALAVTVAGKNIDELSRLPVSSTLKFFENLVLPPKEAAIAERVIKEIKARLGFLNDVGLGYLNLSRASGTLSGGESQRIRLATQIGSRLVGVMYILDEPSIGLHQRDNARLLSALIQMRDLGNTVIVVEHDAETILAADHVLDLGPGAGEHGGSLVFSGTPKEILGDSKSLTGQYLSGKKEVAIPSKRRPLKHGHLTITGARANNLKDITVKFPLGVFTCVTGVSGSGKSTLVLETLYKALQVQLFRGRHRAGEYDKVTGLDKVDKVVDIDQSPIGRTPRSNPATYTGIFTPIRDLFSRLPEARARGYAPGRFSFNVKGGRCEACKGDGVINIEMHFLPDVHVKCEVCNGSRYNRDTLEIKYNGLSISDVLNLTVSEAEAFFKNIPVLKEKLGTLRQVGLGYIRLGQSATTLSGGEAQRVKLSKELSRRATGNTIYILDEPTTGLHFDDVRKLLDVLQALVDQGNTVIVIEHNLDVIKCADHIIDMGPEGGDGGGTIIAQGTPEELSCDKNSFTGQYLRLALRGYKKA